MSNFLISRKPKRILILATVVALMACLTGTLFGEEQEQICRYCRESQAAISPGGGARKYAPDRQVDVLHIKLDVTPDFGKRTIAGTTTIRFAPISSPLTELRLDAVDLEISKVEGSESVRSFSNSGEDLTIVFESTIAVGQEAWVAIDHSAEPTQGFYFRTPEMGYPETDTHVWTQGETHEARHWFPCFDYPNERSSTEVICHVPRGMTVLSNGEKLSETLDEETGWKAVRWLQEKPHVNYLICLVAGYFEKLDDQHRDVPLGFFTQPSLADHAANSFADTAQIMAFFEEEIGVPFPWNKYYQVTIRDFTAGGMENTSLTTLTHNTIFSSETENIRSSRSLDAHEMAHQWFGDYVTCKDWSHLWLNEGFATYYQALYEGHKFGRDGLLYDMYRKAQGVLRQGAKDNRPIVYKGYRRPGEQFDYRSYPKGAWVLHMLRSQLGSEQYRKCIKTYLERHALSSVVTEELNAVLEDVTGKSFDPFFDQWVYHARHPDIRVDYRWLAEDGLARVTIQQTHDVNEHVLLFSFPTKLRFTMKDGSTVDHEIVVAKQKHDFYVALPEQPEIVRFDPEYSVLANVTFKKPDAMLFAQLKNESDMIGRVLAAKALEKRKTNKSVKALQRALQDDSFHGVRKTAAASLRKIGSDNAFHALLASRVQPDAQVRRAVVEAIGAVYRPESYDVLKEVVDTEANPAIAAAALEALGKYHKQEVAALIHRSLRSETFRNELVSAAVNCIRSQADAEYGEELLQVLCERKGDFTRRSMGRAFDVLAGISREREDKSSVRKYLQSFVSDPQSPLRTSAIRALGTLGDRKAIAMLQAIANGRDDPLGNEAKKAIDVMEADRQFVPSEVSELRKKLVELERAQAELESQLEEMRSMQEAQRKTVDEPPVAPAAAESPRQVGTLNDTAQSGSSRTTGAD